MRAGLLFPLLSAAVFLSANSAFGADYIGAEAALKQAQRQAQPENNPISLLRTELTEFQSKAARMAPADAAKVWLALADRSLSMDLNALMQRGQLTEQPQFHEVLVALPPPFAWDALSAAIQAREPAPERRDLMDEAWLLLAHLLKGDSDTRWADVQRMRALLSKAQPQQKAMLVSLLPSLIDQVATASNNPERIAQAFEIQVALRKGGQEMGFLPVPDLVRLLGPQKAEVTLRRVLTTSTATLYFMDKGATRKLARRLALELVGQLRAPQWGLAASLDGGPLYEALEKRFPPVPAPRQPGRFGRRNFQDEQSAQFRMNARSYYMLSRLISGHTAEALAMAPGLRAQVGGGYQDPSMFEEVVRSGHGKELIQFLHAVLDRWPDLPLWEPYVKAALEGERGEEAVKQCRETLQRKGVTPATHSQIRERLIELLLALNRPDEAVQELRRQIKAPTAEGTGGDPVGYGIRLARLGQLLKKDEWVAEGLRAALERGEAGESPQGEPHLAELAALLQDVGRGPEAEKLLISGLAQQAQADRMQMAMMMGGGTPTLVILAELYHRAGRHADVLTLLRKGPSWGAGDLSEIMLQAGERDLPLGYMAAAALADAGEKKEAERVLHGLLARRMEFDPGYELLAKLEGTAALPFLEEVFRQDPFEERPLIWKAYVLLHAGKLDEAEKAARAAIAIDPSDGEQRHGRRMRVYAVLAEILQARGDASQAELYRGVIRAIRMSEEADRLVEAGLTQRGIQLYNQSLGQFADAYCIQSRLAVRLAEQGRLQEAEAHFKRAFELMPSSFGRVETHCLGCEGVFSSKQAQAIAEKVFAELIARNPEKAQVHYLMGYLREQQERFPEAVKLFQEAVRRDPDYLNAWKHLRDLSAYVRLSPSEQNQITTNLVRLDPLMRHQPNEVQNAGDLRSLWEAADAAFKSHPSAKEEKLMPLPESAKAMETMMSQHPEFAFQRRQWRQQRYMYNWNGEGLTGRNTVPSPGEVIASHAEVQAVSQLMDALRGTRQQAIQ